MKIGTVILKELVHSSVSTTLALIAIVAATAGVTALLTSLELHDRRTDTILENKKQETEVRVAALQNDYRKIMKQMGFNVLILPKEQDLSDFYSESFATADMPEDYVKKLASSSIVTIRHLLPSLQAKITLKKYKRKVILMGIQAEVPIAGTDKKKDILQAVKPGTVVIGNEVHVSTGLSKGQTISILRREFTIADVHNERGNKDDITIWMNLKEAQELLKKPGRISAIHALECMCAWADIDKVRSEINKILPNTRIIEHANKALTRAAGRKRAAVEAELAIKAVATNRLRLREQREVFAARLIPVVIVAAGLWLSLLTFSNVSGRQYEIALLRSLGLSVTGIMRIFLLKALALGIAGAIVGSFGGILVGLMDFIRMRTMTVELFMLFFDWSVVLGTILAASGLSVLAAWAPVLHGCRKDPAVLLSRE